MAYSNVIMVGIILILLIILSAKTTFEIKSNNLSVFVPLTYASMNVMLSSLLAKEIGKTHTKKQNLFISLITAIVLAVLIVLVYFISLPYLENAFPMSDAAERLSLSKTYSIILYLSVFSTLLSSMKILNDNLSDYIQKARNKLLSLKKVQIMNINKKVDNVTLTTVIIILILCFTFQNFSFKDVVRVLYPPIGYLGLIKIIREVIVFVSTR